MATVAVVLRNFPQEHCQPSQAMAQLVSQGESVSERALALQAFIQAAQQLVTPLY